ncbi:MAG TPA: NADH:flavin oxidoreductase/NADH oxidase [Stackebrandtia sp.]|jgi:2,4-dienoyl-CoA reductase-like NADH-dependent reductase (Old Yellow Enzyme family)|uniref:NADH:flavin oxidoreductase/NADH oxidase n=1 Tax=Stackebrandtia sp. TaxID=2023065 RepID=UPI002D52FBA0|nr:NADH:flavin oxidoreductase/NADH oxidase [Stackebrandtia sp.]HZE39288.1 NADH:flavin oxidoreductase/NADH oxidase [Stackebrandtia sp.]
MSALFEPITLRSLTIPNRVWMAPMCQYSAADSGPDIGAPTDWHLQHLASRAVGGTGLVMTEATAVSSHGRISPGDLGLWTKRQQEAHARIARFVSEAGAVPAVQLAHAGRKAATSQPWRGDRPLTAAEGGWTPQGPSALAYDADFLVPHELSTAEIRGIVDEFAAAARRALAAGYRVAEVHGAHGYLIHNFLSPHSNHRTDAYGGSFDNRARLALEVVDAVRAVWPAELPVFFRASSTDWVAENADDPREGWGPDDTVRLAGRLAEHGVDLLDVSSGGNVPGVTVPVGPGYQVPMAARVRRETGLPVAAVGEITQPRQAEGVVADGEADAVLLGRELLRDPYWALHAARELGDAISWPRQYLRAARRPRAAAASVV